MDNKEFDRLVEFWKKEKLLRLKSSSPAKTDDCLFFTEFEAYTKSGCEALTGEQKQHIKSCAYCQRMIAGFEKATREEKQPIPIYERLTELFNTLASPFKALPRFAPVVVPVLAVILIFFIFSNQPPELKKYSFEFAKPEMLTRGIKTVSENKFKIRLVTNNDGYAYLFEVQKDKLNFITQEKVTKKTENLVPKDNFLEGKSELILLLSQKPLQNIPKAQEIIIKNYDKEKKETLVELRKELKIKDISFYNIRLP